MRTLTMVSEVPKEQYSPILQWRLNKKLEGAYYVRYGTGDISWKKIASDAAEMLIAIGCTVLAPLLAGPDYTGQRFSEKREEVKSMLEDGTENDLVVPLV